MALLPLFERATRRGLSVFGIESRLVQTPFVRHHVYDGRGRGDLPPVMVLHGISSAATAFAPLLVRLRPHVRRVTAVDAPSHGFSDALKDPLSPELLEDAMRAVLDQLIDEPVILFGSSLGGGVAIRYALDRPNNVRGLFLASPAGATMTGEEIAEFLKVFDLRSRRDALALMKRLYHEMPWFGPLFASDVQRLFTREAIKSFTSRVKPNHFFSPEDLGAITMPVELLWGQSERLLPAHHLDYFKRHLPKHAIIHEPEGIGHCAHLDDPKQLADRIRRFASRT